MATLLTFKNESDNLADVVIILAGRPELSHIFRLSDLASEVRDPLVDGGI